MQSTSCHPRRLPYHSAGYLYSRAGKYSVKLLVEWLALIYFNIRVQYGASTSRVVASLKLVRKTNSVSPNS